MIDEATRGMDSRTGRKVSTYLRLCGLDNASGLGLSEHLWLLVFHRRGSLWLRSLLSGSLGRSGLLSSSNRLLSSRRLLRSGGRRLRGSLRSCLWCGFLLLGLGLGRLGGRGDGLLLSTGLVELYRTRGALWLREYATVNTGLQGLGDVAAEGVVGGAPKVVVGLDVLLDTLTAESSVSG